MISIRHQFTAFKFFALALFLAITAQNSLAEQYQLIYTSDQHYGITRPEFRGVKDAPSRLVNAAMGAAINALPAAVFPEDGGVRAGQKVQWADFVISTGDIANRMEGADGLSVPNAAELWAQFVQQYDNGLSVTRRDGQRAEVLVVPGNHDATDAVGFYRVMTPPRDASSVLAMYNRANGSEVAPSAFDYNKHKVFLRRDLPGLKLLLVQMWPDSVGRAWLAPQLGDATPALLFTHDQPDVESKHLINPNGKGDINAEDKFENLLSQVSSVKSVKDKAVAEHKELANFLKQNPAIVAYFHGNENYNEFYTWNGPENNINMPVFRVDSPMKGNVSSKDESKLSFQIVAVDTDTKQMTVREVLWNSNPAAPALTWGESRTVKF